MSPSSDEGNESQYDVDVKKGFVKGVTYRRKGKQDPAQVVHSNNEPGNGVNNGLKDDNATHPAMEKIVGVEANLEKADKRVVAPGEYDQGDHVDKGQGS
ncbi:hypothetical protein HG530_002442 [Fusarium avenaceum]|nr:hypothetical protein HG530_002442 [Fusarium avenaceum]